METMGLYQYGSSTFEIPESFREYRARRGPVDQRGIASNGAILVVAQGSPPWCGWSQNSSGQSVTIASISPSPPLCCCIIDTHDISLITIHDSNHLHLTHQDNPSSLIALATLNHLNYTTFIRPLP